MSETIKCPACKSEFTNVDGEKMICYECFHEWQQEAEEPIETLSEKVFDAYGNELLNGDSVVVLKDLPVKGSPKPVKAGTKVKNIRLNIDSDHNIDCKIEGFGSMALKSEFVRKA